VAAIKDKADIYHYILVQNQWHFHFIARQYASPGEYEDLYQDILCKIWEGIDSFEGRSAPETWAYRIALNVAVDNLRKNFCRNRATRKYLEDRPKEQLGGRDVEEILNEFLESLPEEQRNYLTLHLADISYQKLAEATGVSEPALRVRISRLKNKFEQRYL
jgi:RNA polymerase sigma factor (sigma-70 family)